MLSIISPAKSQDFDSPIPYPLATECRYIKEAKQLVSILKKHTAEDISALMKVSEKIAELNRGRYAHWKTPFPKDMARAAIFAFTGEVYNGLKAYNWSQADLKQSQKQLRILSGLYGILKPTDLILPYRLEMGTKLANKKGKDLYAFWGEALTKQLRMDLEESGSQTLVNLASKEYFSSIQLEVFENVITPNFKDKKNGQFKIIGVYAKKARGCMARYILENKITNPDDLKDFSTDGYTFASKLSSTKDWVFTRG
jgi:hypothetical protein